MEVENFYHFTQLTKWLHGTGHDLQHPWRSLRAESEGYSVHRHLQDEGAGGATIPLGSGAKVKLKPRYSIQI